MVGANAYNVCNTNTQCDWPWVSEIDAIVEKMIELYNTKIDISGDTTGREIIQAMITEKSLRNTIEEFTNEMQRQYYEWEQDEHCIHKPGTIQANNFDAQCFGCMFTILNQIPPVSHNGKPVREFWLTGWRALYDATLSEDCSKRA
ncbi:hypothetical protein DP148_26605 [Salmonella enterica subsp. enterica serovar Typhimurium]|nr:hypothetical protein DP148_26605 [Salmonella enterica subsp. enterica serovar Typhimurium]